MDVFVCSTGTIGKPLPMDKIAGGIELLCTRLSPDGGMDAAEAMMTTDLVSKTVTRELEIAGKKIRITGLAKGSGMIEPNMATMLAFILTDACVEKHCLQCALREATDASFNRITVDGDRSTNDSVLCLANGMTENEILSHNSAEWPLFSKTMNDVLFDLAMMIVRDGEGAKKLITVKVEGAASNGEANEAARAVANSMLNKTAWAGKSPNWGRIMDAIGYSYAQVQEELVDITYNTVLAVRGGCATDASEEDLARIVSDKEFTIYINLNLGGGEAIVYTCDCTEDYVKINVE
jgi:glutamate N-acetyltransferase/amino-acid N-acetyltransferase